MTASQRRAAPARPKEGRRTAARTPTSILRDLSLLIARRELLLQLAGRDLKVRYKQSVLGIAWAIVQPFALMVVFSVVFSLFVKIKTPGIPYPIFAYVALVPWTYFVNSVTLGTGSLVGNANLVSKIYFPRELFPLASLLATFVDFLIASAIIAAMLLYFHIGTTWAILWLPIVIMLQMLFMFGTLLVLSAANVFYRDVRLIMPLILQLWMYATPVIYPLTAVPSRYRGVFELNPMTGIIDAYRRTIVVGTAPDLGLLSLAAAISVLLSVFGYYFFKSVEMRFADII